MIGVRSGWMKKVIVFAGIWIFFGSYIAIAEENDSTSLYEAEDMVEIAAKYDSLYGSNKSIPERYKAVFYTALSHYPKLCKLSIQIKESDIKSTLVVRPTAFSVVKRKHKRIYQILIDTNKFKLQGCNSLQAQNARVGAMGHELGHIYDYESKNTFGIIGMGICYVLSDKFHKETERWTDSITAEHHLGNQLLVFNHYVNNSPYISDKYRIMKKKYYLSTREIKRQILAIENRNKLKIVKEEGKL